MMTMTMTTNTTAIHSVPNEAVLRTTRWSQASAAMEEFFFRPVDGAILAYFRIAFGGCLLYWAVSTLTSGWAVRYYVEPVMNFTYPGFEWVKPLPATGVVLEFLLLAAAAALVMVGLFYRTAAFVLAVGFTHIFLSDRAWYLNHNYLLCLVAWLMVLLPANRNASLDALQRSGEGRPFQPTVPAWTLWLLRFQVGLPYLFGGIAKLDSDWLQGQPVRAFLASKVDLPWLGPMLGHEAAVWFIAYGGLLFDLLIVPALLWRRTRAYAFAASVLFHLTNCVLFHIGVFPWFMIVATLVFFEPDWPRRLLTGKTLPHFVNQTPNVASRGRRLLVSSLVCYGLFHVLVPLRFLAYGENPNWTERGHMFSWHMMLRAKTVGVRLIATDPLTGKTGAVDLRRYVTAPQLIRVGRDPDMILQLARAVAADLRQKGYPDIEIRALVLTSLNGRKPQLFFDPSVDLAALPDDTNPHDLVMALIEPLRRDAWNEPLTTWERHVSLDPAVVYELAARR